MRTMLLAAAAAAAVLVPAAASAQSAREVHHDQREVRHDQRQVRHDVRRGHYQEAREDRRELREDRRERNSDWRQYRRDHRNLYHRRAYVGPRGWRHQRVTVGYRFAPAYYAPNYWVNDWATYRLPRPGRHEHWVRYGNDVMLVNTRTGRVVAVYDGFFW